MYRREFGPDEKSIIFDKLLTDKRKVIPDGKKKEENVKSARSDKGKKIKDSLNSKKLFDFVSEKIWAEGS